MMALQPPLPPPSAGTTRVVLVLQQSQGCACLPIMDSHLLYAGGPYVTSVPVLLLTAVQPALPPSACRS